jgi:hypothetical protein
VVRFAVRRKLRLALLVTLTVSSAAFLGLLVLSWFFHLEVHGSRGEWRELDVISVNCGVLTICLHVGPDLREASWTNGSHPHQGFKKPGYLFASETWRKAALTFEWQNPELAVSIPFWVRVSLWPVALLAATWLGVILILRTNRHRQQVRGFDVKLGDGAG